MSGAGKHGTERMSTFVTRERVIAPPDRFISGVQDEELLCYFREVFGSELGAALPVLHQLIEGICTADFTALRRRLQGDYEYFGAAAEGRSDVPLKSPEELDQQELRFLTDFVQLMDACQYRLLTKAEWEAAQAEDFLFTLPCSVKWDAMDNQMLPRYWAECPDERERVPEEIADRILVFQRGVDVASMQGSYIMLKINLLISMWLLQPLYALFVAFMTRLGVRRFVPEAPKGLASTGEQDPAAQVRMEAAAAAERHPASRSIERRTFARVFPDGKSVLRKFAKQVKLQEACFRDVVIMYRAAVPDKPVPASEMEVVQEADPKFVQRNIQLHQFRGIPMADLELVMPEKKIFVPPKVFVEMAVTLVGGLVAVASTLLHSDKDQGMTSAYTALSLLAGRAMQVYSSALYQKMAIESAMGKLLYDRTVGSNEVVLTNLVDGVCRQRVREIFICYCILLHSQRSLTVEELDEACEQFLARQFGCKIDFYCEEAVPAILRWGLAKEGPGGALAAVPLPQALAALDSVWDAIHSFKGSSKAVLQAAAAAVGGGDPLASGAGTSAVPAGARVVASAAGGAVAGSGMAGAALGRSLSGQPRKKGVRGVLQRIKGSLHSPR